MLGIYYCLQDFLAGIIRGGLEIICDLNKKLAVTSGFTWLFESGKIMPSSLKPSLFVTVLTILPYILLALLRH